MSKIGKALLSLLMCAAVIFTTACGEKDNTPFKHGTWSGNTYMSEFFGLRLRLGTEWVTISDADLAKSVGIPDMSDSSIQSAFDKGRNVYEMIAARSDGSSVNITIQDNDKTVSLKEKDFFSAGVTLIKSRYEAEGFNCKVEKSTVNFLGKSTDCIDASLTKSGTTLCVILIPVFKSHYTAMIAFGSLSKPDLYIMLGMAEAL